MARIPEDVLQFFQGQSFAVVCTVDGAGYPDVSCKGIVEITSQGKVYLLDLYTKRTFTNLKKRAKISLAAVDEHKFKGYYLKGSARLISKDRIPARILKLWEDKITSRLTQRLLKNIREEKGHPRHPEIFLPAPAYMIVVDVQEVVDLTPGRLK